MDGTDWQSRIDQLLEALLHRAERQVLPCIEGGSVRGAICHDVVRRAGAPRRCVPGVAFGVALGVDLEQLRFWENDIATGHGDGRMNDALELAKIPGPPVGKQQLGRLAAQANDGLALCARGRRLLDAHGAPEIVIAGAAEGQSLIV